MTSEYGIQIGELFVHFDSQLYQTHLLGGDVSDNDIHTGTTDLDGPFDYDECPDCEQKTCRNCPHCPFEDLRQEDVDDQG